MAHCSKARATFFTFDACGPPPNSHVLSSLHFSIHITLIILLVIDNLSPGNSFKPLFWQFTLIIRFLNLMYKDGYFNLLKFAYISQRAIVDGKARALSRLKARKLKHRKGFTWARSIANLGYFLGLMG